ncbi:MAG: transporter substrate-binding domain-containing protein [Gemmobacter sp.]|nr:transporter substrate-binding domain-containing protein [Gemmobacter sp.]
MKLLKSAVAAAILALAAPVAHAQSALNEILTSGVLKVGTTGDWSPMTMKDVATNSYKGYDIDMMTQLAADLGVKVEFVPADWKTLVSGITAGTYHVTGSAGMSPARAKAAGFSLPYFTVANVPLINKKDEGKYLDWDDLNKPEVIIASTLGTTQEAQIKQFLPNAQHKTVEAPARDFQEVVAGRATAHMTSNVEAGQLVQKYPELMIVPVKELRARTPIAMLLPQGDQVWINYINTWVTLKKEAGYFDELKAKWKLNN